MTTTPPVETDAGRASAVVDGIIFAIERGLLDVLGLHETAEATHGRVVNVPAGRLPEFVLFLRERMIDELKTAERLLGRADAEDLAAIMVGYRLGHGTVELVDGSSRWSCFLDLDLDDGRMVGTEIPDPAEVRRLAANLLDEADAIDKHNAGRDCGGHP